MCKKRVSNSQGVRKSEEGQITVELRGRVPEDRKGELTGHLGVITESNEWVDRGNKYKNKR